MLVRFTASHSIVACRNIPYIVADTKCIRIVCKRELSSHFYCLFVAYDYFQRISSHLSTSSLALGLYLRGQMRIR